MKADQKIIQQICFLIIFVAFLSGCSTIQKKDMATTTTDFNIVVEKAQNEMLLLNIIRASKRNPMHFTGFSQLKGSLSYGIGTGALGITFGPGINNSYTFGPSATYTTNPVFDVNVWDNKEFISGILSPGTVENMNYYIETLGWPRDMILHLFVRKIETKGGEEVYENYPGNKDIFLKFQDKLRELFKPKPTCRLEANEPDRIGAKISVEAASNLKFLIEMQKAGLKLEQVPKDGDKIEGYYLYPQKIDYSYSCMSDEKINKSQQFPQSTPTSYRMSAITDIKRGKEEKSKYTFYLRSPEAILYYLGEIVRAETENNFTPMVKISVPGKEEPEDTPLFVVSKSMENDKDPSLAVDYEGTKYSIPGESDKKGRSMHVLSFISLLISQHKAEMKAPPTGTVSLIGGR